MKTVASLSTIVALILMVALIFSNQPDNNKLNEDADILLAPEQNMRASIQTPDSVQFSIRALQSQIDNLQRQQTALLAEKPAMGHINQQTDRESIQDYNSVSEQPILSYEQAKEEQIIRYESYFDEKWWQSGQQETDSVWAEEMQSSLYESQLRLEDGEHLTTNVTDVVCGSDSCTVEFTHQDGFESEGDFDYFNEMMPSGASQMILKQIHDGGIDKTLAIYMR